MHTLTVPPEVTVTATSSRIALGQSTNLTCSITRSVPSNYTIEWTLTNIDDVTTTLSDTEESLAITDIAEDAFGTYTCTVTNSAGLSGSANITIEQGGRKILWSFGHHIDLCVMCYTGLPEVSIDDVEAALPGDNVTLTCNATGDTPLTYQWTMQGSTDSLNTDNTTGILTLTDITMNDFGTYTCTVSNALGSTASDVTLEQASKHILMVGIDVFVLLLYVYIAQLFPLYLLVRMLVLWRERLWN